MLAALESSSRKVFRGMLWGAVAGALLAGSAMAQPGPGGGLSPEERAKIDAAQARIVAADLNLDAEKATQLADAYTTFQKANAGNRPAPGARLDREERQKLQAERQAKLESELKSFLDEAQAKQAADVLAGFNMGWDRMVGVILGFKLDEAKESEALGHTLAYTKANAKAYRENSGNREAMREAMMAARKTLDDSISPLLSEEQKAKWTEETSWGRRGGGDGGGARGDRRDRGGNDS